MSDAGAMPETIPVRDALDWGAIGRWLATQAPELDGPMEVEQFPYGSANLTYLLRINGAEYVLRRPPFGVIAPGAHDMKREYKVLSRLWRVFDRAPRAWAFCDDPAIGGADFFVMERRRGVVMRQNLPPQMAHHPDVARRMAFALVDAMADMHLLDPVACDLGDLGKPEGFAARQVAGWQKRWSLVRFEHSSPLVEVVGDRLAASVPEPSRVSIVHNDLKLDNCQFHPDDPDMVTAVFDWDMGTIGDPLFDLGLLLVSMQSSPVWVLTPAEAIDRYATRSGIDVAHIDWYRAFAAWRTAVVIQQLHNRYLDGDSTDERLSSLGDAVGASIEAATELLRSRRRSAPGRPAGST